jgi:hypothetical protein
MKRIAGLHHRWMRNPEYRKAYAALEPEFALAADVGAPGSGGLPLVDQLPAPAGPQSPAQVPARAAGNQDAR